MVTEEDLNKMKLNCQEEIENKEERLKRGYKKINEIKDQSRIDKDNQINLMLKRKKESYKCIAIGIHQGHFYFGTTISDGKNKYQMIILDDREKFVCWSNDNNEIRDNFGLNYRFELFDDVVDNLWSNQSIMKFLEGTEKEQSFKELYDIIMKKNSLLIFHIDERIHKFIACDIIKNYFYPIFDTLGRTYFQAEFGSGKSRQSLIYQKLSFNSLFASNITPASFERVIESTGGTIIVDNFDNCNDDLKKAILQCIEVYYKKGGKNIKSDGQGKHKNKPIAFNGYSPLIINNIIGLPEVTESRCNKIQMLKTDRKEIADIKINDKDQFWNDTKDRLHLLALQKWKNVEEVYQNLIVSELSSRDLERCVAVLTIAKVVGEDVYKDILNWILENNEQQSIKDVQDDWDYIIYDYLNEIVGSDNRRVKINDISLAVKEKIIKSEQTAKSDLLKFSHYAGKILKNQPLFKKKTIDGWVHYEIKRSDLNKILLIKQYNRYLTIPYLTSLNNTNNTNITIDNINKLNNKVMSSEVSEVSNVKGTHNRLDNIQKEFMEKEEIKYKDSNKIDFTELDPLFKDG